MGWDRLEWGVAGTCRRKCSPSRCWTPQAAPLSLACLVVTVFSLTRDGMRLGTGTGLGLGEALLPSNGRPGGFARFSLPPPSASGLVWSI